MAIETMSRWSEVYDLIIISAFSLLSPADANRVKAILRKAQFSDRDNQSVIEIACELSPHFVGDYLMAKLLSKQPMLPHMAEYLDIAFLRALRVWIEVKSPESMADPAVAALKIPHPLLDDPKVGRPRSMFGRHNSAR